MLSMPSEVRELREAFDAALAMHHLPDGSARSS
jgi:hypothetical protein